ncbi:MAG: 30S ribosomal protein S8 [Microgenomates group bacterium]
MMNDPIIDLIIRIKNAYMTKNETCECPHSQYRESVLKKMQEAGYIAGYTVNGDVIKTITVELSYTKGVPAMTDVVIVSKPGKREYISYRDLKSVMNGMGVSFLSTPKGILTNREARTAKLGGELLFKIW